MVFPILVLLHIYTYSPHFYKPWFPIKLMKKEALFILMLILAANLISAAVNCSDGSLPVWDEDEIDILSVNKINNLGIALTKTAESAYFQKFSAELIVNSARVILTNKTSSEKINLHNINYTVSLSGATETTANIKVDDASKEIEKNEIYLIKDLSVLLTSLENTGDNAPIVKLILGINKLTLTNENSFEKITITNETFLIELKSASDTNAIVRVYTCNSGLVELIQEQKTITQNQTLNNTINETIMNQTTNETNQNNLDEQNTTQVTVAEIREKLKQLQEANQTKNETTTNEQEESPGLFTRIINWFKNLFKSIFS